MSDARREERQSVAVAEGGRSLIRIERVSHPFDEWYRAICPCGWESPVLGASEVGQAKVQHHRLHTGREAGP